MFLENFVKITYFCSKNSYFWPKNTKNFHSKSQSKVFSKKIIFQAKIFPKQLSFSKKKISYTFLWKKFPIFSTLKILMHKNAIKKSRVGQIFRNFGKKLVFFPCFLAFFLVFFVFFWSDIRVFQEKISANTALSPEQKKWREQAGG